MTEKSAKPNSEIPSKSHLDLELHSAIRVESQKNKANSTNSDADILIGYLFSAGAISKTGLAKTALIRLKKAGLISTASADFDSTFEKRFTQLSDKARKEMTEDEEISAQFEITCDANTRAVFAFIDFSVSTFRWHTALRKAFGAMVTCDDTHDKEWHFIFDSLKANDQREVTFALSFMAETANWKPATFGKRSEKDRKEIDIRQFSFHSSVVAKQLEPSIEKGQELGLANRLVRTLAELPANVLDSRRYVSLIEELAEDHDLGFEFWDCKTLQSKGAGAFLAVARADLNAHMGIAKLHYQPKQLGKKKTKTKKLVLVGKGLCFDTGGYNIKTESHMLGMHGDMTGSAVALALCLYFASIEAPIEVITYLAVAENLISPTAYRSNEVVIASDGTSIEVIDTDAEGRMVLADTLAFARKEEADLVLDFATLTGAAVRSLDTRYGAVFSHDTKLAALAVKAGELSGERTWSFPLSEDYREQLKSTVADLQQCASSSCADHIYAATFLSHFIGKETPWVHLDLVACKNKGGLGLIANEQTGFGVLWAERLIGIRSLFDA